MRLAEKHHPDWKASEWIAVLVLVAAVIGFYWKLVLTNQFTWLAGTDIAYQNMPWFQFAASEVHAGRFPLWDPHAFAGQPLLAQAIPGSAYPLNWLLYLLPLKHTWIRQAGLHWYYVVVRILAALSLYWLCRDLGRSRRASVIAGTLYAVAGFVGSVEWPEIVNSAVWVPLVFLFQFRAARGIRPLASAAVSGFFLGLMWLAGHHQVPLFVSLASGLLWIYLIFRKRLIPDLGSFRISAVAFAVAALVSGMQTIPTLEYGHLARRWAGADHPLAWNETVPYRVHELYSVKPISLLSIAIPGLDTNENPFVGAVAVGLALIGFVLSWRDVRVRWLAALALGSFVFALGPNSVFHGFVYSVVPMVEKARVPAHALVLLHLAVCALVAFGIDLFPALSRSGVKSASIALGLFGIILCSLGLYLIEARILPLTGDTRFMVTAVASMVAAALLWAAWRGTIGRRTASALLFAMILLETGNVTGAQFANYERDKERAAPIRKLAEDTDIRDYLISRGGQPFRVEYDEEVIPPNIGDWWGIDAFTAFVAGAPDIVLRNDPYNRRVQAMLGVRYYLGAKPLWPEQVEVFTGATGHKVYWNPGTLPRSWVVHETRQARDADVPRLLNDASIDLRKLAIVTRKLPALDSCSGDAASVRVHNPDRVVIDAQLNCRGMVVVGDTYFPGWHASIDRKEADIYDADGMIRAVIAERGQHTIEMRYRPWSAVIGTLMTITGTLLTAVIVFRTRSKL